MASTLGAPPAASSSGGPPRGKTAVVWFKYSDLRIRDHEPLVVAHREFDRVVHLFVWDPAWHGTTALGGFPKCGHFRARFLLESVADLRRVS